VNLDEFRRTLDEVTGPEPQPSAAARASVRQRHRRARQHRIVGTAAVVVVVATLVVALVNIGDGSRRVEVGNRGRPADVAGNGGVFPDATGTVLILDDGASGIVAVDLDHRIAQRRPTPGGGTQEQPIGIVGADSGFFVGSNDTYAVPFDGSPPIAVGRATEFTRAAEPNDVWLLTWPGGREGSGVPLSLREVDGHGKVLRQATNTDPTLGFPAIGIPEGIAYETSSGVALWDAQTAKVTGRLGSRAAFVDDIHDRMLAWCEDLCATEHITQIGGRDLTASVPTNAASFSARSARFSPDGRYLAAVAGPSGPISNDSLFEIVLIDTQTGASRIITPKNMRLDVSLAWSTDSQRLFFSPTAPVNTKITLGEYALPTHQLHIASVPFWGHLGIAVPKPTARPLLNAPARPQNECPPPVQTTDGSTPTCAFHF
jgi:hypothetical protein